MICKVKSGRKPVEKKGGHRGSSWSFSPALALFACYARLASLIFFCVRVRFEFYAVFFRRVFLLISVRVRACVRAFVCVCAWFPYATVTSIGEVSPVRSTGTQEVLIVLKYDLP